MKKIIFFIAIFCLIISSISTYIISKKNKAFLNIISDLELNNYNLQSKIDLQELNNIRLKERYSQMIYSENIQLQNINLSNTTSLNDLITNPKLIYRFYEQTCNQCIEDELSIIKKLGDSIGHENILILSSYKKDGSLKAIINQKKISSPYYNYNHSLNLALENDSYSIPSFFVLDHNLFTKFVYKTGGYQDINDDYYKRIINFFKEIR